MLCVFLKHCIKNFKCGNLIFSTFMKFPIFVNFQIYTSGMSLPLISKCCCSVALSCKLATSLQQILLHAAPFSKLAMHFFPLFLRCSINSFSYLFLVLLLTIYSHFFTLFLILFPLLNLLLYLSVFSTTLLCVIFLDSLHYAKSPFTSVSDAMCTIVMHDGPGGTGCSVPVHGCWVCRDVIVAAV
jgi:hypothetical protein